MISRQIREKTVPYLLQSGFIKITRNRIWILDSRCFHFCPNLTLKVSPTRASLAFLSRQFRQMKDFPRIWRPVAFISHYMVLNILK